MLSIRGMSNLRYIKVSASLTSCINKNKVAIIFDRFYILVELKMFTVFGLGSCGYYFDIFIPSDAKTKHTSGFLNLVDSIFNLKLFYLLLNSQLR